MRVTVLFENFGPYHLARLSAAAKVCDLSAIELNATSQDYEWQRDERPTRFARHTIFGSERGHRNSVLQSGRRVANAIQETMPDVVAIPGWSGCYAFAALHWCAVNCVPVVIMSESSANDEPRVRWKEWVKRRYVGMCSAALVGGERNRKYLVQLGMPAEKVFLGYDVVDNHYFIESVQKVRQEVGLWRKRLELPERYFLASARFIGKKNLPNLLRAFANYRSEWNYRNNSGLSRAWDLVVLGDGALRGQLDALRQELGLTKNIHFPGFTQYDELPPYYALAGAFIHPSVVEQWGLVVNEAMAAELPVLVSNRCGCAPTLVKEGENGHTFNPQDITAIARCMREMSQMSEEIRQEMGSRSGQIISEFGPERFAGGLHQAAAVSIADRPKVQSAWDRLLLRALVLKNYERLPQRSPA